jgi:hypothetical protein
MTCFAGLMRGENQCQPPVGTSMSTEPRSTSIEIVSDIDIARPIYFPARSRRRGGWGASEG